MKRSEILSLVLTLCLLGSFVLQSAAPAAAQTGGDYDLTWSTADNDGGVASIGGDYGLFGAIGQPDAGDLSGGDFSVQGGFLNDSSVPTAVALLSFSALPVPGGVLLRWETATEIDNLGFHLYRAEEPNGNPLRLTKALIPCQNPGAPVGSRYDYLDQTVRPGAVYYYWLEDIDFYGRGTYHGPVSATASPLRLYLPLVGK